MPRSPFFTEAQPTLDISVIVPVKDAASTIGPCLDCILQQRVDNHSLEVLVVDGGSTDGTRDEIQRRRAQDRRLHLLDNPKGRVSPALNIGLRAARGRVLVRMDAHSVYEPDYLAESLAVLHETGAAAVGGIQSPLPASGTAMAQAIAAAQHSRFGLGGAPHRRPGYEGPARTLWLGAFRREVAEQVGGFDETLFRSEDNDFYQRVRARGGRLVISSRIRAKYRCRPTVPTLTRQYFATGAEVLPTMVRNPRAMEGRHLVPGLTAITALALLALAMGSGPPAAAARLLAILAATAYLGCVVASAWSGARCFGRATFFPLLVVFPVIHATYAVGTLVSVFKAPLARRRGPRPDVE